mmetsp:Transcript_59327/g.94188  ORF Transcript_59327/g.94188 Transcript_59327/m.94188 type:complete len:1003 (+) Transcript_59327:106-3114(+)
MTHDDVPARQEQTETKQGYGQSEDSGASGSLISDNNEPTFVVNAHAQMAVMPTVPQEVATVPDDNMMVMRSLSQNSAAWRFESLLASIQFRHYSAGHKDWWETLPAKISLLTIACAAMAIFLVAAYAKDVNHALFRALDGCVLAAFVVYLMLLLLKVVRYSIQPAILVFGYLLSLLITLAAPSRQRKFLGLQDSSDIAACEEGVLVLWIALLLGLITVFSPMPKRFLFAFGQLVSFQHLLLGLLLARPECEASYVPRGGPGGFLLGLPPIWVSSLQLHVLAALFAGMHTHHEARRKVERGAFKYVKSLGVSRKNTQLWASEDEIKLQNWLEKLVQELETEEQLARDFLNEVSEQVYLVPPEAKSWTIVIENLLNVLATCERKLRTYSGNDTKWKKDVKKALLRSAKGSSDVYPAAIQSFLMESYTDAVDNSPLRPQRGDSRSLSGQFRQVDSDSDDGTASVHTATTARSRPTRHAAPCRTITDVRNDIKIGQWDFDALKVEADLRHVLQVVGFELLKSYDFLPRQCLKAFLEKLESSYISTNLYHSHVHAADMCNTFFYLMTKSDMLLLGNLSEGSCVVMFLAALGHDTGHFARNNNFLISVRHPIAITYNDRSVLENYHASTLVKLLDMKYAAKGATEEQHVKLLEAFSDQQLREARHLMTLLILATDTQKHLEDLASFRMRLGASNFDPICSTDDQQQSIAMLFRSSDIGHSAKPWHLHEEWSRRVVQEFHEQGDEEKDLGLKVSPLCEREGFVLCTGQVGFLQFVCLPTWSELVRFEEVFKGSQASDETAPRSDGRKPSPGGGGPKLLRRPSGSRDKCDSDTLRSAKRKGSSPGVTASLVRTAAQTAAQIVAETAGLGSTNTQWLSSSKVQPLSKSNTDESSTRMPGTVRFSGFSPAPVAQVVRHLAEVHAQCERNFQAWKAQAEAHNADSSRPGTQETRRTSKVRSSANTTLAGRSQVDVAWEAVGEELDDTGAKEQLAQMTPRGMKSDDEHRMSNAS